jgi:hypothetical protein
MTTTTEALMFRETVTNSDGTTAEGTCTEEHAMSLLATATRRGYRIEATRKGGMVITRDVLIPDGERAARRTRTVTLEPAAPLPSITATAREDFAQINQRAAAGLSSRLVGARIQAGFYSIPPAAASRLIRGGLVILADDGTVTVSLAARLAMHAQDHQTRCSQPRGYVHPTDIGRIDCGRNGGGGRSGLVYSASSATSCSCRTWSYPAEDVNHARRFAREHRQAATAEMVRALLDAGKAA